METNRLLTPKTALEIDQRIGRLLRDLGDPAPPLCLEDVRALLRLDLGYYSSGDDSWLREQIHRMKVAGKQMLERPALMLDVVRNLSLKALLLPDKKRILLDKETPEPKQRWNETHEILHNLIPWHEAIAHGDPETTLSPGCHELIEAEANYGAGRLLFLGKAFSEVVRSSGIDFTAIQALSKKYGNTMTTTLWRVVELSVSPSWGLVSKHPGTASGPLDDEIRYFIRSPKFAAEFDGVTADMLFEEVRRRCYGRRGPIGGGQFALTDDRGESREFRFETFYNGYDALTFGTHLIARPAALIMPASR